MTSNNEKSTDYAVSISSNELEREVIENENGASSDKVKYCDPCYRDGKHQKASGFCVDCEEHLCLNCFNFHKKFKLSQHHTLLDKTSKLTDETDEKVKDECVDRCSLHLDRVIEYMCQSCDKLCCSVCIIKSHRKCESVDFIPDIIENIEQSKVFLDVNKAFEDQSVLITDYEKTCEINKYNSRKLREYAKEDVKIKCQEIRKWLTEMEKEMIGKIEIKYSEEQQRFDNVSAEVKVLKGDLEMVKSNISTKTGLNQRCQLFVAIQKAKLATNQIQRRLQDLDKVEKVESYRFKEAAIFHDIKSQRQLGTIVKASTDSERKINFLYFIPTRRSYPGKMCMISDKMLVLRESFITTLSMDPGRKEDPNLSELDLGSRTADITKISDTEVAVTFPDDGVIKVYKVITTGKVEEKKTIQVGGKCQAIQYFKNNFIVSYCHYESGSISIIDMSGQLIKEIVGSSKKMFQTPLSLALNSRSEILYVADSCDGTVTSLSLDGIVLNKFASEYCDLYGISTDVNGSVYAFYICQPKIIQLCNQCKLVKEFDLEEKIKSTAYLHAVFSEIDNVMYASTFEGEIRVFEVI